MEHFEQETGKQRSQRIQIDYYRQTTGLDRVRWIAVALGALIGIGYGGYVVATSFGGGGGKHLSTGPVAMPHAAFEQDCEQCHLAFSPMDSNSSDSILRLTGMDAEQTRLHLEEACQKCHPVANHHRSAMQSEFAAQDQNCAGCHRDHQGRDFDLRHVASGSCISCHGHLSDVLASNAGQALAKQADITGFTLETHGDFRGMEVGDTGRVKFSHHQHMLPGQVPPGSRGGMTLNRLRDDDRQRYRRDGQDDSEMVTLDCNSCHRYQGDQSTSAFASSNASELGQAMRPIAFEEHCQACHAISTAAPSGDGPVVLPHAVTWERNKTLVAAALDGGRKIAAIRAPGDVTRRRPVPGLGFETDIVAQPTVTSEELNAARLRMETQCLECHEASDITDEAIRQLSDPSTPSLIPERRLRAGRYDHGAHHLVDCQFCHADAYPAADLTEQTTFSFDDNKHLMISGIESCQDCHRPATSLQVSDLFAAESEADGLLGRMPRWYSDDCITCHRYHGSGQVTP